MLVQIKELLLENSVIMWILLADIQNVNNSFPPWSRNENNFLLPLDIFKMNGCPPKKEQHQNEKSNVPNI